MKQINLILGLCLLLTSFNLSAKVVAPKQCYQAKKQYHSLISQASRYSKYKYYVIKRVKMLKPVRAKLYHYYKKAIAAKNYKLAYYYKMKIKSVNNQMRALYRKLQTISKIQRSIYYRVSFTKKRIAKYCAVK